MRALRDAKQKAAQAKIDSVVATVATAKTRYTLDSSDGQINTFNSGDDATKFGFIQPYILVKGVQVANVPTLLDGTGMGTLVVGNLNVGTLQGSAPQVTP